MSEDESQYSLITPRINGSLMEQFIGKTVRLVGKIEKTYNTDEGTALIIKTSDGLQVTVEREANPQPVASPFVEIIGTVKSINEITEVLLVEFGEEFGFNNLNL